VTPDEQPNPSASNPSKGPGPAHGRRVIAVGGGRGGVGKSLLTVNLGVYFAQLGRSVVVCDADPYGSNLHSVLGLGAPPLVSRSAGEEPSFEPMPTSVPGLKLLPTLFDPMSATPVRPNRRALWNARVSSVDADYVLLHIGGSTLPPTLDLFLSADISICVAAPEPVAVETTYGFLRALYARALRRKLMKERFKLRLVERGVGALPPLSSPREIIAAIHRIDTGVAQIAAREMDRLMPRLVVSQTRLRSDLELGPAMASVSERYLGVRMDYLGHVENDDAVWLTVRRRSPLLIDQPTSKSARNIERVARRILALLAVRPNEPPPSGPARSQASAHPPLTLYEVLGVSRGATDDEIRRACKRQREIYREGSIPLVSLVSEPELRREQARIEEGYDTLLDMTKRRAYDLSTFPDESPPSVVPKRSATAAAAAELLLLQAEVAKEIHAETQFSGDLLRKVRESQGVELSEIAHRTKISTMHLKAIEDEALGDLPAAVYVQGFVKQFAKYLSLDPTQVSKTYIRRLREIGGAGGGG